MPTDTIQINFDTVVEGFFYLDLILNFFVEFKDPDSYENVRELKRIAGRYVFK